MVLTPFERFIVKYQNILEWDLFSAEPVISEYLFGKLYQRAYWPGVGINSNISQQFLQDHYQYLTETVIYNPNVSEDFIHQFVNRFPLSGLQWKRLSYSRQLSEEFVREYRDKVHWQYISKKPYGEDFFEEHLQYLDWREISRNPAVSENFLERHIDKIDWIYICGNHSLTVEFFERHVDKVDAWRWLSSNPCLTDDFVERHLDKIDWYGLSSNPSISLEFFERHLDKVHWYVLSSNPSITEEFISKYPDKIIWTMLESRTDLSETLLEKHQKYIGYFLRHYRSLTESLAEKYIFQDPSETAISPTRLFSETFCQKYHRYLRINYLMTNHNVSIEWFQQLIDFPDDQQPPTSDQMTLMFHKLRLFTTDFYRQRYHRARQTLVTRLDHHVMSSVFQQLY